LESEKHHRGQEPSSTESLERILVIGGHNQAMSMWR
jgi:hypothetical protein